MVQSVKTAADAVLNNAVKSTPGVPGVVAIATDRNANTYEGAFGVRQAGANVAMGDGSVRTVSNDIDLTVWRALSTTQGAEAINGDN